MQLLLHKISFLQVELRELLENGQLVSWLPECLLISKEIFIKNQFGTLLQMKKEVYCFRQALIKLINSSDGQMKVCKRYGQIIPLILPLQV